MTHRVFDIEVYKDYFLVALRDISTGEILTFEMFQGQPLDLDGVRKAITGCTLISFNGNGFDIPLLSLAMEGADNATIKKASDAIIVSNFRGWQLERMFKFEILTDLDHIDLIEVAPGMVGLKIYGGRLHTKRMQDLPIDPSASISPSQRAELRDYCCNDLVVTQALYEHLLPQIHLREAMGHEYGLDLRSKSDAQIAEVVIGSKVSDLHDGDLKRPEVPGGTTYKFKAPGYIQFTSPVLQDILTRLQDDVFTVVDSGKVNEPDWLKDLKLPLGGSVYRMGIGGLHSTESRVAHVAGADTILVDRDVASYYPSIILGSGLAPAHMGDAFLKVYRSIVQRRLAAKHSGDKVTADALKITINGSFGKFGSKWSVLYSPNLLIQTTVSGQLALLMLIEQLEDEGISVVSANTDGVVISCPRAKEELMESIVFGWELVTGFDTEATYYKALYSRDVNNYVALKDKGYKAKGVFALDTNGIHKNPVNEISTQAAIKFLQTGTPVEETIKSCTDIRRFVTIRSVKGGALDQLGGYLGKAVRWYYSTQADDVLTYKINGYSVPRSEGAMPLMELPDEFPLDVDYDWYIAEATQILNDIGALA